MAMVVHPPAQDRIEERNQGRCRRLLMRFHDSSNFFQERLRVVLTGCDKEFAVVFPDILSEEVETGGDMRDVGFLARKCEVAFVQELCHQWTDALFQQFTTGRGDDE